MLQELDDILIFSKKYDDKYHMIYLKDTIN